MASNRLGSVRWYRRLQTVFTLLSILFLIAVFAVAFFQINMIDESVRARQQQATKTLAISAINQAHEKAKTVIDSFSAIRPALIADHERLLRIMNENPALSLQQIKEIYFSNQPQIDFFRFNNQMTVVETTYKPDLGLNVSSLGFLQTVKAKGKICTKYFPDYNIIYRDYTLYSAFYRPEYDDYIEISIRKELSHQYQSQYEFLRQIPNLKSIFVYVREPELGHSGLFHYQSQIPVKNKKEYDDEYGADFFKLFTTFLAQMPQQNSGGYEDFTEKEREFIFDKIIYQHDGFPTIGIRAVLDTTEEHNHVNKLYWLNIGWIMVVLSFIIALLWIFQRRVVSPIVSMSDAMKHKAHLPQSMTIRKDEIGVIAKTYDIVITDLLKEISYSQELIENQQKFIRTSIHEINTPLMIISLYSELLRMQIGENTNAHQIEAGVRILKNTFEDLSYLIKRDTQMITRKTIDLVPFTQERIDFFNLIARMNTKSIVFNSPAVAMVWMDGMQLQRLIDNTLSNAIKYSNNTTTIDVEINQTDEAIVLSIINEGETIENTQKIFELYARENSSKGGYGIGLTIVREICEDNGIVIDVQSAQGKTVFRYFFPREST